MATANEHEKYQQWLAQINQVCGSFAARPLAGEFHGELHAGYASGLKLSTVTAGGINLYRNHQHINSASDAWFYTVFQLEGEAVMEQDDRQTLLKAGDITLIDASRPCSFFWQQKARQVSLLLPRRMLERDARCAQRLAGDLPMVQLSHRLLQESMSASLLTPAEREAALEAMVCLLRPALYQQETPPAHRDKRFQKVVALIEEQIQSPDLRPDWIASACGMSVRSLYRLFADRGLVVAQYIKNRRLDLCAQALCAAPEDEKLASIGFNWGFTDHSHFSTAFRQRFGMSPGEYRRRSR